MQIVEWVDVFTRKIYRDIVIDSLKYCMAKKGLELFAYVIMSNHIHLIARSNISNLSGTILDFKKFTASSILDYTKNNNESRRNWMLGIFENAASKHKRNKKYQVWTHENHAELVYSNKFIQTKLEYIHLNPVRAGIVENAEDYLYSSARNYASLTAKLEIILLPLEWKSY